MVVVFVMPGYLENFWTYSIMNDKNRRTFNLKKAGMLVLLAMLLYVLSACGGGGSGLVGSWEAQGQTGVTYLLEFSRDGTGYQGASIRFVGTERSHIDWETSGSVLTIFSGPNTWTFNYSISGSTLTLISVDESSLWDVDTFERV